VRTGGPQLLPPIRQSQKPSSPGNKEKLVQLARKLTGNVLNPESIPPIWLYATYAKGCPSVSATTPAAPKRPGPGDFATIAAISNSPDSLQTSIPSARFRGRLQEHPRRTAFLRLLHQSRYDNPLEQHYHRRSSIMKKTGPVSAPIKNSFTPNNHGQRPPVVAGDIRPEIGGDE